jgi:hypothetical protein
MAGAEREIGMPSFWVGLETVDPGMASLLEPFPACEIRTPILVTKTAIAAKSPIWAAHRWEIIASSATPLFFLIFRREMYSVLDSALPSRPLSIYISQIHGNATKNRDNPGYFYCTLFFDKNSPSIKFRIS